MGKVLIVYFSLTGKTQRMAEYIAEGVRFTGQQAVTKKTPAMTATSSVHQPTTEILLGP